ncbi:MAG: hypothetical protein P8076_02215 [Gammaproteobacteria bacterium]
MNTVITPEDRHVAEFVTGGSAAEIVGGVAAVVLAILGLAHVAPRFMLTIATIAIGAALLFEGASIAAEYSKLLTRTTESTFEATEMGGGMTAQMAAGIAGVVLGILALLGLDSMILAPAAAIVFGTALAFSSGMISRLNDLKIETSGAHATARKVAREAVSASAGTQVLIGLGTVVLGILALVGIAPMVLSLVALLSVGASVLLSGSAVSGKILAMVRR